MLDTPESRIGDLTGFAGVIVGGSSLNVTDFEYSRWQRRVHAELSWLAEQPVPTLFICFGTTFLAYDNGGRVSRSHPETSGPTVVELTGAGRLDPLTRDLPQRFTSLTGHTENVEDPGRGVAVLATGPSCPVQMVRANAWTWACQFHADMDARAMQDRMDFYYDYGYFSPADYGDIVAGLPGVDTTWSHAVLRNFIRYCTAPVPQLQLPTRQPDPVAAELSEVGVG